MSAIQTGTAFLCALPQEGRHLRTLPVIRSGEVRLAVTGVGPANAQRVARELLSQSKRSLVISVGVAGALSADLKIGEVIVASEVVDEATVQRLRCHLLPSIVHPRSSLLSVSRMITSPAEKAVLASRFHAVAVDMESAAIARVCAEHGVPFAAIRAISDTAQESLPPAVTGFFDSRGTLRYGAVMTAVVRTPSLIGTLRKLQKQTETACGSLHDFLLAESAQNFLV